MIQVTWPISRASSWGISRRGARKTPTKHSWWRPQLLTPGFSRWRWKMNFEWHFIVSIFVGYPRQGGEGKSFHVVRGRSPESPGPRKRALRSWNYPGKENRGSTCCQKKKTFAGLGRQWFWRGDERQQRQRWNCEGSWKLQGRTGDVKRWGGPLTVVEGEAD